jgi:[ribosomal protein S5]-alanine N-acetyltransferase
MFPREFTTERLLMRLPTQADAERIFSRYGHDPLVCRYMNWVPQRTINDTLEYLERSLRDIESGAVVNYLIFARTSNELLGSVGGRINPPIIQWGYCLARDSWGHGFATEAACAFVPVALDQPAIWRLQAFCDLENQASARVLAKAGLTLEGILRCYMVMPNLGDIPRDVYCYAKVREA